MLIEGIGDSHSRLIIVIAKQFRIICFVYNFLLCGLESCFGNS